MITNHNPYDWYWIVAGDEARAWSSAAGAYVAELPAGWHASAQAAIDAFGDDVFERTDVAVPIATRIASEGELTDVLKAYGLAGPVAALPASVTPYQARIALLGTGLIGAVEALMADPETDQAARIAWEYATAIERDSPFIAAIAPALGLTEEQIDGLFIAAAAI